MKTEETMLKLDDAMKDVEWWIKYYNKQDKDTASFKLIWPLHRLLIAIENVEFVEMRKQKLEDFRVSFCP